MIYFFYGEEDYLMDLEIEKLKKGLDKNFIDMNFKKVDNPSFADLTAILRTQGLMFGKMLFVIDILDYFKKSIDDKQIKELTSILEGENIDIVFTAKLPRDTGEKIDKRKKFFKLLSKFNPTEFNTIPTYKVAELDTWIKKFIKAKSLKISAEATETIINRIGNNLRQIDSELDKVKLYIHPRDLVEKSDIEEICVNNEDIFAFSEFVLKGEKDKALLEYNKLLATTYPLAILSMLQKEVRTWIILKAKSASVSAFELSKLTGMHEYRIQLTLKKLKNVNLKDLVNLKEKLTNAEYRIKAGQALNVEDEVQYAIF
ncbi:MAG: DNA polymerase III subunit delta [Clostridiaceae bacterium]|jgi:DNA polymerase III subunit delta|nr:DNA polymerase III subunit delta [Clostridiaceae bacterium]